MIDKVCDSLIEDIVKELEYTKGKTETLYIVYDAIKKIVPSDEVHILTIDKETLSASLIDRDNGIVFPLDKGGILAEVYQSHQPLLVNDIKRSLLYNKEIDSLGNRQVSKVLSIPILGYKSSNIILGIVWIALYKGYRQFIQQDIDNVIKFINTIKNRIFLTNTPLEEASSDHRLLECQEAKRLIKVKLERNENYFASLIHDIRTPMNAVIGFMELMLMGESDEQKRDYINATLKSSDQMVSLINDILDMSKVANGQMTIDKSDFSPLEPFGDIAKLFYNSMIKNSIKFNIYIDPMLPLVIKSDIYRIKQIVNNLLSNAMKFTPIDKDVSLTIKYQDSNKTIEISIKDTGIGIAKDRQKSIFNPYTQENDNTASKYGGTGLGLAISQQLSTLLDGTLTLNSIQGEGSEFVLTMPCEVSNPQASINIDDYKDINILFHAPSMTFPQCEIIQHYFYDIGLKHDFWDAEKGNIEKPNSILCIKRTFAENLHNEIQSILDSGHLVLLIEETLDMGDCLFNGNFQSIYAPVLPNILFDKLNILLHPELKRNSKDNELINDKSFEEFTALVIDDSRTNLKLMLEILKKFNLTIKTVINPKDALEILEETHFDVIFIDQNMPIMQGDEAIKIIRQKEIDKGQKPALIYGLTGDINEEIIDKIIKSGANRVFSKPIHIVEIYEAISVLKD
ncbi:MAG: ATP-binding protein [Sulfurovum sp.]